MLPIRELTHFQKEATFMESRQNDRQIEVSLGRGRAGQVYKQGHCLCKGLESKDTERYKENKVR